MLNQDYKDMLEILSEKNADFIIVGAYALAAHGYPRATGDIDILVNPTQSNAAIVIECIAAFGAPTAEIEQNDFATPGNIYQIGVEPCRIDIITRIDGIEFEAAKKNKVTIEFDGLSLPFLSLEDLIKNKSSTGRKRDLLDIEIIKEGG